MPPQLLQVGISHCVAWAGLAHTRLATAGAAAAPPARTGAIALGHPAGATGVRQTVTLLHELARRQASDGQVRRRGAAQVAIQAVGGLVLHLLGPGAACFPLCRTVLGPSAACLPLLPSERRLRARFIRRCTAGPQVRPGVHVRGECLPVFFLTDWQLTVLVLCRPGPPCPALPCPVLQPATLASLRAGLGRGGGRGVRDPAAQAQRQRRAQGRLSVDG